MAAIGTPAAIDTTRCSWPIRPPHSASAAGTTPGLTDKTTTFAQRTRSDIVRVRLDAVRRRELGEARGARSLARICDRVDEPGAEQPRDERARHVPAAEEADACALHGSNLAFA